MTWHSLSPTSYPTALCNDGSTAGFFLSSNLPSSPKNFFIYLESGGWCYDQATCDLRNKTSPALMSSSTMPPTNSFAGIFDASPLEDSVKVFVHYCTSDGHMGSAGTTDEVNYQFRGRDVVKAVVETVEGKFRIKENSDNRVIFGGASAGARGAMVHLDWVSDFFAPVRVAGVLDSPLWVDLDPPFFSREIGLKEQTKMVHDMAKVPEDILSEDCHKAFPDDPWKCMFGAYRMNFITTNHLLVSAQFDSFQLGEDLSNGVKTPWAIAYADGFGEEMKSTFIDLETSKPGAMHYSQPCYNHAISTSGKFFTTEDEEGNTWEDALETFLEKGEEDLVILVDGCDEGFTKCSQLPGCNK
ncbi:hypothetical protein TrCOL_g160 [Triparma columacea]|uniref:Pectin acetylesterase n=1 Tax=Triparma columacea TaxID=722753 RepID=A0A9W7GLE4_9STRA|nr:hypothetical protein TrCOL_g160 [Triparma columacea]